ncbi:MAG: C4-dicarboxylate transporter DcuC [Gemmataceae bacterium]
MTLLLGVLIVAAAVIAVFKRVDVRLALLLAALALGALAGQPMAIVQTFLATFSNERFVVPICSAMGFAHVLRHTGCDKHLVHLLVRPLRQVRVILIPGAVLVGFLVNIPVISQTSTAVAIGSVLVPILVAARFSPVTIGAALLLGASVGGELLNPGAPELQTVTNEVFQATQKPVAVTDCIERLFPLVLVQLIVATAIFWFLSVRAEARYQQETGIGPDEEETVPASETEEFCVNYIKAVVPVVPLALLFLTGPPLNALQVPETWLVDDPSIPAQKASFDTRLIGAAMLIGVVVAALTAPGTVPGIAKAFFEGAGYAFASIVSLIVTANCFGTGVKEIGFSQVIGQATTAWPALLLPTAGVLPFTFAWVSGSGMAATQSLYELFVHPSLELQVDPLRVGAVVSIASAAGRTMSPVAAVVLMCAALTNTNPIDLMKRIALPLLAGLCCVVLIAMW